VLHGDDDILITGTAAQIAFQTVANLGLGRIGVALQQIVRAHNHARRAKAALQAVLFPKRSLQRMQIAVLGQAFDRGDLAAVRLHGEHGARFHRLSIHQHGARAALARVTAEGGSRQAERLAQKVRQQQTRLHFCGTHSAVDGEFDFVGYANASSGFWSG
jgi:hypothetical protein